MLFRHGHRLGALGALVDAHGWGGADVQSSLAVATRLQSDCLEALSMTASASDLAQISRQIPTSTGLLAYSDVAHLEFDSLLSRCANLNWLGVRIQQWANIVREAMTLASDLLPALQGQDIVVVELSDDAHFDRRVVGLGPVGECTHAYKPGSYDAVLAWARMTDTLNSRLSLPVLALSPPPERQDFVPFIPAHTPSMEQIPDYYRCFGITLGLLRALGASDGHVDNFVPTLNGPLLIDVETAFAGGILTEPVDADSFKAMFMRRISDSVLGTGAVSRPHAIDAGLFTDWGALRRDHVVDVPTRKIKVGLQRADAGRICPTLYREHLPRRAPTMPRHQTISYEEIAQWVCSGFEEFQTTWIRKRPELFMRIVEESWEGISVRSVQRPTHSYMRALWRHRWAEVGPEAVASRLTLPPESEINPPFTPTEARILASGNVPTFHERVTNEVVDAFRRRLPRIEDLDEAEVIRASLGLREEGLSGLRTCAQGPYTATRVKDRDIVVAHPVGFSLEFGLGGALPVLNALVGRSHPLPSSVSDTFDALIYAERWPERLWLPGGELHGLLVLASHYPSSRALTFAESVWNRLCATGRIETTGRRARVLTVGAMPIVEAAASIVGASVSWTHHGDDAAAFRRGGNAQAALVRGALLRLMPEQITEQAHVERWIDWWLSGGCGPVVRHPCFSNDPGLAGWTGQGIYQLHAMGGLSFEGIFLRSREDSHG